MTRLLLDFPWPLEFLLDPYHESSKVLHDFEILREEEGLERVRFISANEFDAFRETLYGQARGGEILKLALQLLPKFVYGGNDAMRAGPVAGPNDLSNTWRAALRQELTALGWPSPQIVAHAKRKESWRESIVGSREESEIKIETEDTEEIYYRVFVELEQYVDHKFARSDRDPWDLRRTKPHDLRKPCCLPKPVELNNVPFWVLQGELAKVRESGWKTADASGEVYRFIPPVDWSPDAWMPEQMKAKWRNNGSFRKSETPDHKRVGYIDFEGRVWCWDIGERHWDVEFTSGGYYTISHTGRLLKDKT